MQAIMIGGGGQCRSMMHIVKGLGYDIVGIVDGKQYLGQKVDGAEIIYTDEDIENLTHYKMIISIGITPRAAEARKNMYLRLKDMGVMPEAIISRCALMLADYCEGVLVHDFAYCAPGSVIGDNTIINTGAVVEHDVVIGRHCHIAPNATVIGGVKICDDVIVGAGSVVLRDIDQPGFWAGNPARLISITGILQ